MGKFFKWLSFVLVIVGALNWGLVGIFSFDLVAAILGPMSMLSRVVYALVGISAIYQLILLPKWCCKAPTS